MLKRLARGSVRHRRLVITAWLVGVVGMLGLGATFAGENNTDFSLPGTESQQAADLLEAAYGGEDPFATGQVVIATDPSTRSDLELLETITRHTDGVVFHEWLHGMISNGLPGSKLAG